MYLPTCICDCILFLKASFALTRSYILYTRLGVFLTAFSCIFCVCRSLSYLHPRAYFVFVHVSFVFESKSIFCICRPPGAYRLSRVRTDVGLEQRQACRLQPTISSGGHTRDCVPPCVCLPHHLVFIVISIISIIIIIIIIRPHKRLRPPYLNLRHCPVFFATQV